MLPIFPLSAVLLPDGELELKIFEQKYREMLTDCLEYNRPFGIVFCGDEKAEQEEKGSAIRGIGCIANITECRPNGDGSTQITVRGTNRFFVGRVNDSMTYIRADGNELEDIDDLAADDEILATAQALLTVYREALSVLDPIMLRPEISFPLKPHDSFKLIDQLILSETERQTILELGSRRSRFSLAVKFLNRETERIRFLLDGDNPTQSVLN